MRRQLLRPSVITLVLGLTCAGLAAAKIPVILSTDVGNEVDDQWAIVYMLTNPDFDVLGIVCAQAPTLTPPAAHTTFLVLRDEVGNRLRMAVHPPLFEGSSLPLEDTKTPRDNAGVRFMIDSSKAFSNTNRLNVLTIGAATDLGSALLEDATLADRIRVIAMGFNGWPNGGNEFNVANDVAAWQVILQSNVPVVVGSGNVCRANLALTLDEARNLVSEHGPVGRWLWDEFQAWYYRFVKPLRVNDLSKPWIIWDIITLAYEEGMTTQEIYPRPALRSDMNFDHVQTSRTITWITGVDSKRLWPDFISKLDAYERTHDMGEAAPPPFLP